MPQRREGLRLVFRLLAILAVVLIPFGIYYYLYFDRQYDYHVNRNFRVLTEAGQHLSALLGQFESFFDVDPYNEIEETGYPIRAIVEKRFAVKGEQTIVKEVLDALRVIESGGEKGKEKNVAAAAAAFRDVLQATEREKEITVTAAAFRDVLQAALGETQETAAITAAAAAFRDVLQAALGETQETAAITAAAAAFRDALWTVLQVPEREKEITAATKAFEIVLQAALDETEREKEITATAATFRDALRAALAKTQETAAITAAAAAFRDVLQAALGETQETAAITAAAATFRDALRAALAKTQETAAITAAAAAFRDVLQAALNERTFKAFRDALRAALDKEKGLESSEEPEKTNEVWNKVAEIQRNALTELIGSDTRSILPYEGQEERKIYIDVLNRLRSEALSERIDLFNKNPVYKNLTISPNKDKLCEKVKPKEAISLWIDTFKAQTPLSVLACQKGQAKFVGNFEAKLSLADLMRNAEAENFDLLILAQEDGTVIYSSAEAPSSGIPKSAFAKFSNLKPFFQKDQSEATIKEATPKDGQSSIPLLSIIQEAEDGQVPIPLASIIRKAKDAQISIPLASVIREAGISGTTYLLFLQPFQPPFPIVSQSDGVQPVWYLGGVIRKGEFQKKFLAVPLTVTGLTVLGLVLGILSLPYIKLFFVNAGEPLKATDIFFLAVSLVLSSGLITLLLLNTVAYHNMRAQFDETARKIGKHIQTQFGKELNNALNILSAAPAIVAGKEPLKLFSSDYPPYESAFLVDRKEVLNPKNWRTYPSRKSTEPVRLSERQYFTHARDEWELWERDKFPNFFIERVHSYTNGVKLSILSRHNQDCERNDPEECFPVAGLAKGFISFRALALPSKFGFAVIEDNTGKVIFHSDDQRSLIENFFWEADNNLALQAAVHARQGCETDQAREDCKIDGHYNGTKHHFFVTPIKSVPWSLVVFYDTRLLETVNFELGVVAAGIFFLYVVLFGLWIAIIHLPVSEEYWSWYWPQSQPHNRYVRVAVLLLIVVLYYGFCIRRLEGSSLFLLIVSLPLMLGLLDIYSRLESQDYGQELKRGWARFILFGGAAGVVAMWIYLLFFDPLVIFLFPIIFLPTIAFVRPAWISSLLKLSQKLVTYISSLKLSQKLVTYISSRPTFQSWYLIVVFLSLLVVSVLPSAAIFKDAFRVQSERLTKFRESEFVVALGNREKTLLNDMYGLAGRDEVERTINTAREKFVENTIEPGLYEYTGDCFQNGSCKDNGGGTNPNWHISEWFIDFLPVYNKLAGKLRYPMAKQADFPQLEYSENIRYQALSRLPIFLPRGDLDYRIAIYLCTLLFLFVLFILIRALAKRTVGLYLPDFEVLGKGSEETLTDTDKKRRILIRPPRALVSELEEADDDQSKDNESKFEVVDLSSPIPPLLGQLREYSTTPPSKGILVTNFEASILEPRLRLVLLEVLEKCVQVEIPVILYSSVSPLYRLVTPEAYPEFDEGIQDAVPKVDEKFRWSALLSTFWKERFWHEVSDWRKEDHSSLAILSRECRWTDELMTIYADLKDEVEGLTKEQIILQVGDRAGAFYRKLWMLCTKEERLVLMHLAQDNLVNLKETDVLQRLLWRNLIRRDPDFRLPNESFARFVLAAEPPARIAEWEKSEADGSTWAMLRVPLLLLLVLVAAFIARTGGEGVQAMTAIVSAVFAGLPILIQALGFLRGGQTDKLVGE